MTDLTFTCRLSGRGRHRRYVVEAWLPGIPYVIKTLFVHWEYWHEVSRGLVAPFNALITGFASEVRSDLEAEVDIQSKLR